MSSLVASKGKALFANATGHADESLEDEFDLQFSDDDDDEGETKSGGGGAMSFGSDGAMSFGVVEEEEVEAMAVKPFIGAIFPPSSYHPSRSDTNAPSAHLQLEYVFGYCKKTRDAVFSLGGGKIFWPSASVGIIHDTSHASGPSAQSHLIGHRDEITSAAQSPQNPTIIATGSSQLTRKHDYPKTIVWDTSSKRQMAQFQSINCKRQVDALAFDSSGQYVFAAGAGDKHNIVCYSIADGGETSYVSSGSSRVLAMDYDASTNSLVVGGVKSLQFIPFQSGNLGKPQRVGADTIISVKSVGPVTYVGGANGKISSYSRGSKGLEVSAHKGGIFSIAVSGRNVATGGKDGTVALWSADGRGGLSKVRSSALEVPVAAKGIAFDGQDIVVGSKAGRVVKIIASGSWHEDVLVESHCDGETWGLCMHPFDLQCVTTGDDNTLRVWDLVSMTCMRSTDIAKIKGAKGSKKKKVRGRKSRARGKKGGAATTGSMGPSNCSRAVDYDPFAEKIAVGMNDGSFVVFDEATLEKVAHKRGSGRSQWVQDLKFSPLDKVLAVSTHDNFVDLWSFTDGNAFSRFAVLEGHRSFITHLDWSADGRFIQTNCGAYELLFWDTKHIDSRTKKVARVGRASSLADTDWQTITSVINWGCTGIWYSPEGYMLNACDRSHDRSLLAVGEDSSLVKLYKWPCVGTFQKSGRDPKLGGADGNEGIGHGSHVSNVRFAFDDSKVVSVGGDDNATMVWSVVQ